MLVAFGIGTIHHAVTVGAAMVTNADHAGVYTVHFGDNAVVEYVAFAFKVFAAFFDASAIRHLEC
jgi:hypothetical protein